MNIDPIAFSIGSIHIRWYGIAYVLGFILGMHVAKHCIRKTKLWMSFEDLEKLVSYITIGIIIGGRLGYCLVYDLSTTIKNPISILKVWEGGMSFHGALIGIVLSVAWFKKKFSYSIFLVFDLVATSGGLGIFFGRIGNFINQEHIGYPSNHFLSIVFERIDLIKRHPVQIYEALFEGLIPFLILNAIYVKNFKYPGKNAGIFLILYAFSRFILEFFRIPDGYIGFLTMGQFFSLPMFIVGYWFFKKSNEFNNYLLTKN